MNIPIFSSTYFFNADTLLKKKRLEFRAGLTNHIHSLRFYPEIVFGGTAAGCIYVRTAIFISAVFFSDALRALLTFVGGTL